LQLSAKPQPTSAFVMAISLSMSLLLGATIGGIMFGRCQPPHSIIARSNEMPLHTGIYTVLFLFCVRILLFEKEPSSQRRAVVLLSTLMWMLAVSVRAIHLYALISVLVLTICDYLDFIHQSITLSFSRVVIGFINNGNSDADREVYFQNTLNHLYQAENWVTILQVFLGDGFMVSSGQSLSYVG
jgi:hypothetical protein